MTGERPSRAHDSTSYGESVAVDYDLLYPAGVFDTEAAVAAVADLAGLADGEPSVLEFGIGTGRLALPLLERGVAVAGIDASERMVASLRGKPRGEEIEVVVGDFGDARVERTFSVVLLAVNGITDPPTRDAQIACFRNAARHLAPRGCFVVESYVLRGDQLHGDWAVWPRIVQHEHVELQLSRFDTATSVVERTLVHLRADGLRFVTVQDNYAWPGELDLMARMAGLRLRHRHGGWEREPFGAASRRHVSVYELAEAGPTGSGAGSFRRA